MTDFPPINVLPGSTYKEGEPRLDGVDVYEEIQQNLAPIGCFLNDKTR